MEVDYEESSASQPPNAGSLPSKAGCQPSSANSQLAGSQPSTSGSQPSASGLQPSTSGCQSPTTSSQHSLSFSQSSTFGGGTKLPYKNVALDMVMNPNEDLSDVNENIDLFESSHSHFIQIRRKKRTSKSILYTLITNHEKSE